MPGSGCRDHVGMRRKALPQPFDGESFTVKDATAAGIPRDRLRAGALDKSVRGVRSVAPLAGVAQRCRALAQRLDSEAFVSHTTAALVYGAPLSLAHERSPKLHISVPSPARPQHAAGIVGHHLELEPGDVVRHDGLRITSPERTWFDLASMLSLPDLVAVGDYLIHWRRPLTTRQLLEWRLWTLSGKRGIRMARAASDLLVDRCESRPESHCRVAFSLGGLPEPEINHTLIDTETGGHLRPDFLFRKERVIIEYQGDYHRTKAQWRKDMTRRAKLEAAGWYVMEINADDLRNPEELVARIRQVLSARR